MLRRANLLTWLSLALSLVMLGSAASAAAAPRRGQRDKISGHLRASARKHPGAKLDVIIRFREQPNERELSLVASFGGHALRHFRASRWVATRLPASAVAVLSHHPPWSTWPLTLPCPQTWMRPVRPPPSRDPRPPSPR